MTDEDKLYKQRRNLIISSLLVIIYEIIGLNIKKFNVLGNRFEAVNDQYVIIVLIAFWVYSFVRYYQYSNEVSSAGYTKIKKDFLEVLDKYSKKVINKKISQQDVAFSDLHKDSKFKFSYSYKPSNPLDTDPQKIKVEYELAEFIKPLLKTFSKLLFSKPTFSEYILPYVLAFVTIIVLIVQW